MWRIIIVCMMLLFSFGSCSAAIPNDLAVVLQQPKDLNRLFEIGLTRKDFSSMYQQIYIDVKRLEDKQPQYTEDLDRLLDVYKDIDYYWEFNIEHDTIYKTSSFYDSLNTKYPGLFKELPSSPYGTNTYWFTQSVVSGLMKYPGVHVKSIESKYQ